MLFKNKTRKNKKDGGGKKIATNVKTNKNKKSFRRVFTSRNYNRKIRNKKRSLNRYNRNINKLFSKLTINKNTNNHPIIIIPNNMSRRKWIRMNKNNSDLESIYNLPSNFNNNNNNKNNNNNNNNQNYL
jgi:hypothetical protein